MTPAETWAVVLLVFCLVAVVMVARRRIVEPPVRDQAAVDDRHLVELLTSGVVTPEDLLAPRVGAPSRDRSAA